MPKKEKKLISQITIPTIGSDLILEEPWAFMLYHESRNIGFLENLGHDPWKGTKIDTGEKNWNGDPIHDIVTEVALPKGTRLKVDRIYIKKGAGRFDSVTFTMKRGNYPGNKKLGGRFWVKLNDVNRIVCSWDEETVKRFTFVSPLTQLAAEAPTQGRD